MDVPLTADDGTTIVARRTGGGTPVVLVHGSAGGLDSWDPVAPLLADTFELWVYARRGYAPSGGCGRAKTFADDVADLAAVLAAAGGSAHVVGASYGAVVALHAARRHRRGIRSLALFEPPLYASGPELSDVLDRYRGLLAAGDLAGAARLFAERVARVPAAILDALGQGASEPDTQAAAEAQGCLHDLEAMSSDRSDPTWWADIDLPVLLMQGSETWPPMPATMETLAGALPHADRAVLAGQAHFATHTAPALFAAALTGFLAAHT